MHELWKYGDNYGGACVSSLIGNPGSPVVQQGLSDGNRIHEAQTGGRAAHAPSLRHPFLPHARNQNTCAAGRSSSSMQVHRWANGASGRRRVHRDLSRKPIPSTIAPAALAVWPLVWLNLPPSVADVDPFPSSRRQCRNYPLRPPGPSERCLAIAPYLEPSEPSPPLRPTSLSLSLTSLLSALPLSSSLPFSCCSPSCASDCPTHPPLPVSTVPTPVPRSPSTFSPRLAGVQSSQRL